MHDSGGWFCGAVLDVSTSEHNPQDSIFHSIFMHRLKFTPVVLETPAGRFAPWPSRQGAETPRVKPFALKLYILVKPEAGAREWHSSRSGRPPQLPHRIPYSQRPPLPRPPIRLPPPSVIESCLGSCFGSCLENCRGSCLGSGFLGIAQAQCASVSRSGMGLLPAETEFLFSFHSDKCPRRSVLSKVPAGGRARRAECRPRAALMRAAPKARAPVSRRRRRRHVTLIWLARARARWCALVRARVRERAGRPVYPRARNILASCGFCAGRLCGWATLCTACCWAGGEGGGRSPAGP